MTGDSKPARNGSRGGGADDAVVGSLQAALAEMDEPQRYQLLASLFGELAGGGAQATDAGANDRSQEVSKRLEKVDRERANLEDKLATTQADLAHRTSQFEAEQVRADDQQRAIEEQRARLESLQHDHDAQMAELVAKNTALHAAEVEQERLMLQVQRLEASGADDSKADRIEASRRELAAELEQSRQAFEKLRTDKEAQVEQLNAELNKAKQAVSQSAESLLGQLWLRLASTKPSLVEGHVLPNVQAAERLVDAFIELAHFADEFDNSMRVFLGKYTKHNTTVKVPWEVYAKRDDVHKTVRQTIAVKDGRPAGLLKMRLRMLLSWAQASMIGCDSAIESIASELETHLRGEMGLEGDPNRKVKDYLRDDGHYHFLEHIHQLRSKNLAESFGRAG